MTSKPSSTDILDATKRMAKILGAEFVPHNKLQRIAEAHPVGDDELRLAMQRLRDAKGNGDPAKYLAGVTVAEAKTLFNAITDLQTRLERCREMLDEAFDLLGGVDDARELRGKILSDGGEG